MSKVLVTGMSAPHTSKDANTRSLSFAGAIVKVLEEQGHIVIQEDPDVSWNSKDLEEYDSVLVGISPLTSLSANRVYGALSVIDVMLKSPKLRLLIDAPEPTRITSSLKAISKTPDNLTKPFYSYRKSFSYATQPTVLDSLIDVIDYLITEKWPVTLYPSLPWGDIESVKKQLPELARDSLMAVNIDSYLLSNQDVIEIERREKWVVENYSTPWIKSTAATLANPTVPMKWHKGWTDAQVLAQIASGIGALITPHQNGTWWSYRIPQCLNSLTPIATNWQESSVLGDSWMYLAARIEDLSEEDRVALAYQQREAYVKSMPSRRDAAVELHNALGLYSKKGTK